MAETTQQIVHDAEWMAHRYQADIDAIHFRRVTRAEHAKATFLTDAYLGEEAKPQVIPRSEAIAALGTPAPLHFIFHSAFCCSSILARALDLPGVAMGLKEPMLFNDLVGVRHRGEAHGAALAERLESALLLLARPFSGGEAIILKPSNVVNALAPVMMKMQPGARALLLHAPLETFLKSIAKKGLEGRLWARDLLLKFITDDIIDLGFSMQDYLKLTDLQAAAVGWLTQQALFERMMEQFGSRIRTLDSETLLADPEATIAGISLLFGLDLATEKCEIIAKGPAFATHSKTGQAFGSKDRDAEYAAAASNHADEISKVAHWAGLVAQGAKIPMRLPAALIENR